jgi:hypothetical protein
MSCLVDIYMLSIMVCLLPIWHSHCGVGVCNLSMCLCVASFMRLLWHCFSAFMVFAFTLPCVVINRPSTSFREFISFISPLLASPSPYLALVDRNRETKKHIGTSEGIQLML